MLVLVLLILYAKEIGDLSNESLALYIDAYYRTDMDLMYDEIHLLSNYYDNMHIPIGDIQ